MKLYDLLVEGYHTPLTAAQIAELFHAGRLQGSDHCKEVGNKPWRMIDELFPLLKYDSSAAATNYSVDGTNNLGSPHPLLLAILSVLLLLAVLSIGSGYIQSTRSTRHPTAIGPASDSRPRAIAPIFTDAAPSISAIPATAQNIAWAAESRAQTARMREEERARQLEATRAAEQRIIEERLRNQQQAQAENLATREFTIPLGTYYMVNVGGRDYRIAIHDDGPDEIRVIIDYDRPVRLRKRSGFENKEIETLILSNGQERLYYVNEISEHIGHCTLRLRNG